jgi:hypothetical protein
LGNNATSEEATDELAPASVRGRLVKAPTPPRRPSALSAARGSKVGTKARQAKRSADNETPEGIVEETTQTRREGKATRKPEQDKLKQDKVIQAKAQQEKSKQEKAGSASAAAVEKEESVKKPAAKAPAPARSPAASASANPATVAPLGVLRAAARGASSAPTQ